VAADGESEDPSTLEATLLGLASACREETDLRLRASELAKSLRELDDEMERLGKEIVDLSRGWDALMTEAGASDEAEFLRKLSVYDKRQELKRALTQGEDTLVKAIGRGSQAEAFRELLAAGEVVAWEGCLQHAHEAIEELGIERAGLNKGEGDIERRLRDIEQSGDVAAVETDLEGLKTELDSAMERWRTNSLASLLVRETLAQFTQERQPLVLAEASRMFQCLTLGRYIRVQRSTDEEGLVVLDADGRVKSPDELSRGAAEQLYLCLRLGLAEEFARRAEPMPLVMDDVLVNFDAARRRTTAELLLEFAGGHQVLLFTCHEEITQLIHDLDASVGTIELS
jgi:uncharacterized protein YhaN